MRRGTKKFEDAKLLDLLNEDPTQTLQDLSTELNVDGFAIGKHLHPMGMVQIGSLMLIREGERLRHVWSCTRSYSENNRVFFYYK